MTGTVSADQVLAALKILSSFNAAGALAAFEGQDTQAKVVDGLIALDDVAKIVGLFIPPVAVVANDLGLAIEAEQMLAPFVIWLNSQPFLPPEGTQMTWGTLTTNKGLFQ